MKTTESELKSAFDLDATTFLPAKEFRHIYNKKVICVTDSKGYAEPNNQDPAKIRVDATDGFIPLWDLGVSLNWRFSKSFDTYFKNPEAAKHGVRKLFGEAILAWKDSCPVKFREVRDAWDFEISMHREDCDNTGCVLASAFFPGAGQNTFYIYPTMFHQSYQEQIETIIHEMGHIFGLRHFFANITESRWRSELFGTDSPFSIMNYGDKSKLTDIDIEDLKRLYQLVWSNQLIEINGTPIKKFISFHMV
ncbi:matrixin family metalloprotease [Flavobacterium anhuiense]|uniref:Matrixin n=1 Tax=Flavobacterium anhuiense TaxID=459526 RepID=A0ABY0LYS0_9FLAO|nr:matrixin family metalloprotease [Flavobacterium anhuiense]SCY78753.1 Matrixin [Flavobacterium anhuiense]